MTSADANNVRRSTGKIFIHRMKRAFLSRSLPQMTRTVQTGFNDAFRKENGADCATAAGPEQEAGQGRHPSTLVDTVGRGRGGHCAKVLPGRRAANSGCRPGDHADGVPKWTPRCARRRHVHDGHKDARRRPRRQIRTTRSRKGPPSRPPLATPLAPQPSPDPQQTS